MVSGQGRGSSQGGGGVFSAMGEDDGGLSVSGDPLFSCDIASASIPSYDVVAVLDPSLEGALPIVGLAQGDPSFVAYVGPIPGVAEMFIGGIILEDAGEIVMAIDLLVNLVREADLGASVHLVVPEAAHPLLMPAREAFGCTNLGDAPVLEAGRACDDPCMSASDDAGSQPSSPSCVSFPVRSITTRSMAKAGSVVQSGRRGGEASGKHKNKNKRKPMYDAAMAIALEALFRPPNYEN